jgi:hypothetical protein
MKVTACGLVRVPSVGSSRDKYPEREVRNGERTLAEREPISQSWPNDGSCGEGKEQQCRQGRNLADKRPAIDAVIEAAID